MKQKIVSYLKSIESDLFNISKYLYDNPKQVLMNINLINI